MNKLLLHRRRGPIGGIVGPIPPDPDPEPPTSPLLGVGSDSESLTTYPRIANVTVGDWYVDASRPSSGNGTSLATAFKTLQEGLAALKTGRPYS